MLDLNNLCPHDKKNLIVKAKHKYTTILPRADISIYADLYPKDLSNSAHCIRSPKHKNLFIAKTIQVLIYGRIFRNHFSQF